MADALTLDVGGAVHVADHGGDGPPMVLVHGLGGSLLDWRDVVGPLSGTHRVWSLDLIGFGRTPLAGRPATIQANQRLVDGVIERLAGDRPVVLVGNSMGGLISLIEAARRPQRVSSLILVDPALPVARGGHVSLMLAAGFLVAARPRIGPWLLGRRSRRLGAERLVDQTLALCTADVSRVSAETREAHIQLAEWREGQPDTHRAFVDASRSLVQWLWHREAVERHIQMVRAPTLLVHGDEDRLVSIGAAAAAAALRPDWGFRVMDNTGHIPQMERAAAFVNVVEEWLASDQPARVPASRR